MLREKLEFEQQIKRLQERLKDTEQARAEPVSTSQASDSNPTPAPTYQPDTPASPHGLTPRIPRPQDVAYQDALKRGND